MPGYEHGFKDLLAHSGKVAEINRATSNGHTGVAERASVSCIPIYTTEYRMISDRK
jgi:hypothetical protein